MPPNTPLPIDDEVAVVPVAIVSLPEDTGASKEFKEEKVQPQASLPSRPADTTFQQDLTMAGQRHINVMWESTQKTIAIWVTIITLIICGYLVVMGNEAVAVPAFMLLSNVFFLVVGTYFQRTNHTKTGGVGPDEKGR